MADRSRSRSPRVPQKLDAPLNNPGSPLQDVPQKLDAPLNNPGSPLQGVEGGDLSPTWLVDIEDCTVDQPKDGDQMDTIETKLFKKANTPKKEKLLPPHLDQQTFISMFNEIGPLYAEKDTGRILQKQTEFCEKKNVGFKEGVQNKFSHVARTELFLSSFRNDVVALDLLSKHAAAGGANQIHDFFGEYDPLHLKGGVTEARAVARRKMNGQPSLHFLNARAINTVMEHVPFEAAQEKTSQHGRWLRILNTHAGSPLGDI